MGMFDSVWVNCDRCGKRMEFQSKAGECVLGDYTITTAPPEVLADLNGESQECCGVTYTIRTQMMAYVERLGAFVTYNNP